MNIALYFTCYCPERLSEQCDLIYGITHLQPDIKNTVLIFIKLSRGTELMRCKSTFGKSERASDTFLITQNKRNERILRNIIKNYV